MDNTLTVGFAVFDDTSGAYFTVAGLRANHRPDVDIVCVDNHPLGCPRTRAVVEAAGGRYYHKPNLAGTSAPRDEVFRLATTPWVMVCDSHVLFETGAVDALVDYAEANPDCRDLIQGPLIYDNGAPSTHWRPTTPPGLWGVWDDMWVGPDYRGNLTVPFVPSPSQNGRGFCSGAGVGFGGHCGTIPPEFPLARQGFDWETREAELRAAGCKPARETGEPFEIPMQGLGVWAMRREAWPGFNPLFKGFGGEEGYIHELTRRLGGRAMCLPALRWRHRFRDPRFEPSPYPLALEDHVWNLLVGHRELGVEAVGAIRTDFGSRLPPGAFDQMVTQVARCQSWDAPGGRPDPLRILGVWYSNNTAPPKVLKASLDSIKRAADLSRADVGVVTCPWSPVGGNPFTEVLAEHRSGPGHLSIVRQIRQGLAGFFAGGANVPAWWEPDVVCPLEHDVLYPPDYFDRVARAFRENPGAPVVSNLDYEGLNGTGWLRVRERHEPMHQISMRYDVAVANLDRAERECEIQGWALLEPDSVAPPVTTDTSKGLLGFDMDGTINDTGRRPPPGRQFVVITGRPLCDGEMSRTKAELARDGIHPAEKVYLRDTGLYTDSDHGIAAHKAESILTAGVVEFWEDNAVQVDLIRNACPGVVVHHVYGRPSADRSNWARIPPSGRMPAVHINH